MVGEGEHRRRGLLGRVAGAATERVVTSIDPDAVLGQVDVTALVDRVDVDRLLGRVDLEGLLDRVDLEGLLDRVDLDRLLDRVDLDRLLDRVDLDRLLDRVNVDQVLDRVNVDQVLDRVDVEAVVRRSGIPDVVAASTTRMAGSTLDVGRRQVAGLDAIVNRLVDRALRRRRRAHDNTPPRLEHLVAGMAHGTERLTVTGHFAGPVSRAIAAVLDILVVTGSYTVGLAGLAVLRSTVLGGTASTDQPAAMAAVGLLAWGFLYAVISGATAGRTVGKALTGLRLVRADGAVVPLGRVVARTLLYPVCTLFAGLGFLPILLHRQRRGLHDLLAGTAVVYDWGERPAELPGPLSAYLARHTTQR